MFWYNISNSLIFNFHAGKDGFADEVMVMIMIPDILLAKNLPSLYYNRLRRTTFWGLADRVYKYSRRFLLIGRILKYTAMAIVFIETSALLLSTAVIIILLLPIAAAAFLLYLLVERLMAARIEKRLNLRLDSERIYVFFRAGEYGQLLAQNLAVDSAVYVVKGLRELRFIGAAVDGNVIYLSRAFFLRLRQKYFDKLPEKLCYIF